jgi:hypothetical protein
MQMPLTRSQVLLPAPRRRYHDEDFCDHVSGFLFLLSSSAAARFARGASKFFMQPDLRAKRRGEEHKTGGKSDSDYKSEYVADSLGHG